MDLGVLVCQFMTDSAVSLHVHLTVTEPQSKGFPTGLENLAHFCVRACLSLVFAGWLCACVHVCR